MGYRKDINITEFKGDWNSGMSLEDMCKKYGYKTAAAIRTRAKELGLNSRAPSRPLKDGGYRVVNSHGLKNGNWRFDPVKRIQVWVPEDVFL